ncbi:carboxymuconolactone decarboxylase [Halobacteriovorax marinus]|uniref:Carboxymuconolactone decarboxylase n=1 Tax=Halobacteriovorax marinus TaxID=97084 RepID=A0A1Y5F934_9BACT|nr:carboxymuconolactone decarboxylase [Halobacteriovorax marinus]
MTQRLNYFQASPNAFKPMMEMEKYIASCYKTKKTLDHKLIELVKIRVSQINGCAYCIDMHTKDARAFSEDEQRIFALSAWREAPFYTDQERAALEWAEVNTLISTLKVTDDLFDRMKTFFTDEQLVDLTMVVTQINAWNRIALSFKPEVGSYTPGDFDV